MKKFRSLGLQLLRLVMVAASVAIAVFLLLQLSSNYLVTKHFSGSELQNVMSQKRLASFSRFVEQNHVAATDTGRLLQWCEKQPMVLMEVYRDHILFFNSNYTYDTELSQQNIEANYYNWYSYYKVPFADGTADVLVYSDESYVLQTWLTVFFIILSVLLFVVIVMVGMRKTVRYIYLLCDEIQNMGQGDLEHAVTVQGDNELGMLAEELEQMRAALFYHRQKEQEMIRQNKEMITGLSHDLRTPLTKILLYTEIIQNGRCSNPAQEWQYLDRIREKGMQMKQISEHLLKYSLAQKENVAPQVREESFKAAFYERFSECVEYLTTQGFQVETRMEWKDDAVSVVDLYLDRIIDNIVSNICKYANPTHPVELALIEQPGFVGFTVKNERLLHADQVESNGVGLGAVRTMMQQMGGICSVEEAELQYTLTLLFVKKDTK